MSNTTIALLTELESTKGVLPGLEAAVRFAQDRLRLAEDKIAQIDILLTILRAEEDSLPPHRSARSNSPAGPAQMPRAGTGGKGVSKVEQLEQEIFSMLSLRGTLHRKDILQRLIDKGIMGHEKDPMAHLAAFLSTAKGKFESDGKGNFRLRSSIAAELQPVSSADSEKIAVSDIDVSHNNNTRSAEREPLAKQTDLGLVADGLG